MQVTLGAGGSRSGRCYKPRKEQLSSQCSEAVLASLLTGDLARKRRIEETKLLLVIDLTTSDLSTA